MIEFCKDNIIDHYIFGKIVVASDERETGLFDELANRRQKNALNTLKFLNREELKLRETHLYLK